MTYYKLTFMFQLARTALIIIINDNYNVYCHFTVKAQTSAELRILENRSKHLLM